MSSVALKDLRIENSAALAIRAALAAIAIFGIGRAVLVAWADWSFRQSTPASIAKAERLLPSNPLYPYTRALILEQSEPGSAEIERAFSRAIDLNPRYSDALLAWSVEREMRGDRVGSEQLLREARRIDQLVRPEWALANYYFRQGQTDLSLEAARETLRIIGVSGLSEGRFSINPIFELCWKSGASADEILRKGIPNVPVILGGYLSYVLHTGRNDDGPAIVDRIIPTAEPGMMFFLKPYLEDLLVRNHVAQAAKNWKEFHAKGLVPYRGPDPSRGIFLTNGDFAAAPLDYGFDWRRMFPEPVQFFASPLEHSYRFDFDGTEAAQMNLLVQIVPLRPAAPYRLKARFESDVHPQTSGLRWSVHDHKTGAVLPSTASVTEGDESTLTLDFAAPAQVDSGDVTLSYHREPGTPPLHGYYRLARAELQLK